MSSILDIDLDYFNLARNPVAELSALLKWADRPVDMIVDDHGHALRRWIKMVDSEKLPSPSHILHVDEHHDMMDQKPKINCANVMVHALTRWPRCRVFWLFQDHIDTPAMWLDQECWEMLRPRFSKGSKRPRKWPKPDIVSITTSPAFISPKLRNDLLCQISAFRST